MPSAKKLTIMMSTGPTPASNPSFGGGGSITNVFYYYFDSEKEEFNYTPGQHELTVWSGKKTHVFNRKFLVRYELED